MATDDLPFGAMDYEVAIRWGLVLAMFTSAANRRVKDSATRALTKVFRWCTKVIDPVLDAVGHIDDDDLTERTLLAAYGALLISRDLQATQALAAVVLGKYQTAPEKFQNALIRDHIRCIAELAQNLVCLSDGLNPLASSIRGRTSWKPTQPSEAEWKVWSEGPSALRQVVRSCANDDFNHYSIGCLGPWMDKMGKSEIGRWLVKHLVDEFGFESPDFGYYDKAVVNQHGGGRSKPAWAERIGKKYQWIALFRLASRLYDKYPRKSERYDPKPARTPLLLQEERKLDPTIPTPSLPSLPPSKCWWLPASVKLETTQHMSFRDWVSFHDDLPSLEKWLSPVSQEGKKWQLLHAMLDWGGPKDRDDHDTPYRNSWIHLRSFLVPNDQFENALLALSGRNYFQGWLPEGGKWIQGFLGEYPWATAYNTEPDWYQGAGSKLRDTEIALIHTSNSVVCEWEYDGTLRNSLSFYVPAKQFFEGGGLAWNGSDGFADTGDSVIFRDPHAVEGGKGALIANAEELPKLLDKLGYRLLWTLLGEKWILGQRHDEEHLDSIIYSQMAYLRTDGTLHVGERRYDSDLHLDTGPHPSVVKRAERQSIEFTHNSIRING